MLDLLFQCFPCLGNSYNWMMMRGDVCRSMVRIDDDIVQVFFLRGEF